MSDGLMSQSIENVRNARAQVAAVDGLPTEAVAVQSHMVSVLDTMVPAVQTAASGVLRVASEATAPLAAAEAAIGAGDGEAMRSALESLTTLMGSVTTSVKTAVVEVQSALGAITADNQTLANIGSELQATITRTSAEADTASAEADALDRDKWWYLLLGPFGLPGLAACIGMIVTATNKVNGIRQQVSDLRAQSAQWTKVKADVDLLSHDVPSVSKSLLSVQAGLEFLGGDTSEVVKDVAKAPGSSIGRAWLIAANQELAVLTTDAS